MAERPGVEHVLTRLNDLADRLVSNKRFDDLTELVQKLVDSNKKLLSDNETLRTELVKATKAQGERSAEMEDFFRKELKKLREEVLEAMETIPAGDSEETTEAIEKTVEKYIGEAKGLFKWLVGDDPDTVAALRGRVRDWVGKKGKKALTGGDDE